MRWLIFLVFLVAFGQGQFAVSLMDALRQAEIQKSDWAATNVWLESAKCARASGALLAICDGSRLVPISEYALADDPGHALFIGILALATKRNVSLADVACLNIAIDALGFIALACILFAMRAYLTVIAFLALGPVVYLGWVGTSPHWSFIGVASLASILPLALAAREYGWLSRRSGSIFIVVGVLSLALAVLIRESIGMMGLLASLGTAGVLAGSRIRAQKRVRSLVLIGLLVLAAAMTPRGVLLARDVSFAMEPAHHVQTHGLSHTLYIGLGTVENRFGIRFEDSFGAEAAKKAASDVPYLSPDYYRIMWKLYLACVVEDPLEVAWIYLRKAGMILDDPILDSAPKLWIVLAIAIAALTITRRDAWRRVGFAQGRLIVVVALVFIGLFIVQAVLAQPSRLFAAPAGAFVLVLLAGLLEFFCRSLWVYVRRGHVRPGNTDNPQTPR
jgi:hypothetical protein